MVHYKDHVSAVNHAYCGSDDESIDAMSVFKKAVSKKIEDLPFTHEAELGSLLSLNQLYCVRREKLIIMSKNTIPLIWSTTLDYSSSIKTDPQHITTRT